MSDEVATQGNNLPANPDDLLAALANMQAISREDKTAGTDGAFMKFKEGVYSFGAEDIEPEEGSRWAVNPASFTHGYQAWGARQLLGEVSATMGEKIIRVRDLEPQMYTHEETGTEVAAKWTPLRGFILVCTTGEDQGAQCYISGTSMGLTKAVNTLIAETHAHVAVDSSTPVAIISLESDSYQNKKWKKTVHVPVFRVVDWVAMDATVVDDTAEDVEPEEPVEPVEPEEPAPPKRRRRRAA